MLDNGKWVINLDNVLDVEQLKSLDYEICMGIALSEHHLPTPGVAPIGLEYPPGKLEKKYKDTEVWDVLSDYQRRMFIRVYERACLPVRAVYVKKQNDYSTKHLSNECEWHENAKFFPGLIKFIQQLPFKEFGRIEILVSDANNEVPTHRDVMNLEDFDKSTTDFLWLSPRGNDKKFYVSDDNNNKHYTSHISWFNETDKHGSDSVPYSTYSIRVDGIFTDEFKEKCLSI